MSLAPGADLRAFEWLATGYFAAAALAAPFSHAGAAGRRRAILLALACAAGVVAASSVLPWGWRAWLPLAYLPLGYWIPALLVPSEPTPGFGDWLMRTDRAWHLSSPRVPAWIAPILEAAYLACYVLVPATFAVVWFAGGDRDVERFWLMVLLAGYACYATVPWLVARPPRFVEPAPAAASTRGVAASLASFNTRLLARVSHQWTTFPSGHVAVATAAALALAPVSPLAAGGVALVAAGIALGAVAGRYHFGVDVVAGAIVGGIAALISG
jgi:membrane-associated phospholipid phosphatase